MYVLNPIQYPMRWLHRQAREHIVAPASTRTLHLKCQESLQENNLPPVKAQLVSSSQTNRNALPAALKVETFETVIEAVDSYIGIRS